MELRLAIDISRQPDDETCGPTSLHAVYRYYGDAIALDEVIAEVPRLKEGGTLGVHLGCHALERGYDATLITYNLHVFDPTWSRLSVPDLLARLEAQKRAKQDGKLQLACDAYIRFLQLGGRIRFDELRSSLLRRYLNRSCPILTGLSATYLYRTPRELSSGGSFDDIRGEPSGHFVILCGYDRKSSRVLVADPLEPNPLAPARTYEVKIERLIGSIFLGILTHDANLLVIEPSERQKERNRADPVRGG